jgi:hypothetical protein
MSLQHSPRIITDGLVLCLDAANRQSYPGSGTVWRDLAGSNNGTLTNGPTFSSANRGRIVFDGSNDYINFTSIPDTFWNNGSWSVSLWIYFATVNKGSDNAIIGHGTSAVNNGLHLGERARSIHFGFYANDLGSSAILNATTWYNIVWTFNFATKLKQIYLNGGFITSGGSVGYGGTGTTTRIGEYVWSSNVLNGFISNAQFYNKVLSPAEIQQNYNATKGRYNL